MPRATLFALTACVLSAALFAAGPNFREVAASTNAAAHLELSNDAVKLRVFPQEGGRVEGCTNLCTVLSSDTNNAVAWRLTKVLTGERRRTLWLEPDPANGVSRTLGLTLRGGTAPLEAELILANGTGERAETSGFVSAGLQPFERRSFRAVVTNGAPVVFAPDPADVPMNDARGKARMSAVNLAYKALAGNGFKEALGHFERAIGYGGASAELYVGKAYCLRKLGASSNRLRAQSSRTLRTADKIEPLDTWNLVERAFLEDDGEGAAKAAISYGGDMKEAVREIIGKYRRLGAKEEISELERQVR